MNFYTKPTLPGAHILEYSLSCFIFLFSTESYNILPVWFSKCFLEKHLIKSHHKQFTHIYVTQKGSAIKSGRGLKITEKQQTKRCCLWQGWVNRSINGIDELVKQQQREIINLLRRMSPGASLLSHRKQDIVIHVAWLARECLPVLSATDICASLACS